MFYLLLLVLNESLLSSCSHRQIQQSTQSMLFITSPPLSLFIPLCNIHFQRLMLMSAGCCFSSFICTYYRYNLNNWGLDDELNIKAQSSGSRPRLLTFRNIVTESNCRLALHFNALSNTKEIARMHFVYASLAPLHSTARQFASAIQLIRCYKKCAPKNNFARKWLQHSWVINSNYAVSQFERSLSLFFTSRSTNRFWHAKMSKWMHIQMKFIVYHIR